MLELIVLVVYKVGIISEDFLTLYEIMNYS